MARLVDGRWSPRPEALVRRECPVPPWDRAMAVPRKLLFTPNLIRCFVLLAAVLACVQFPALAQTDVNDIHVQQREVETPKPEPKAELVSTTNGLSAHVRPLKIDVDLVLVPVTITDPMNRLVTG